jgi:uncharacterized membrane protein
MSSRTLYRLSGLALLLGGVIAAVFNVVNTVAFPSNSASSDPKVVTAAPWQIVNLIVFFAGVLVLLGLPGAYLRQARQTGALGLIGFILIFTSWILVGLFTNIVHLLVDPTLATVALNQAQGNDSAVQFVLFGAALVIWTFGLLLFSIATLRARVLPHMAAIMLLVALVCSLVIIAPLSSLLNVILGAAGFVLSNLALAWFGFALLTEKMHKPAQVTAASSDVGVPA